MSMAFTLAWGSRRKQSCKTHKKRFATLLSAELLEDRRLLAGAMLPDLVAYWSLDVSSAVGSTFRDSSPNGYSATISGAPQLTTGIADTGLRFDGQQDYLNAGRSPSILGNGGFSVAAWVKLSQAREQVIVQQRGVNGYNGEYVLQTTTQGNLRFWTFGDNAHGANVETAQQITDGNWHHVVAIREASGRSVLWIDGVLDGQASGPARTMASMDVVVGADSRSNNKFLVGELDEVQIYNRAITSDEVLTLLNSSQPATIRAHDDTFTTAANQPLVVSTPGVLANDDGSNLAVSSLSVHSRLGVDVSLGSGGDFTYAPQGVPRFQELGAAQTLVDDFQYRLASDSPSSLQARTGQVQIVVIGVNDPPVARNDQVSTHFTSAVKVAVLNNDEDIDRNDVLTIASVDSSTTLGQVQIVGRELVYDPSNQFPDLAEGETATDTFHYRIVDSSGAEAVAQVYVTITGGPPITFVDDSYRVQAGRVLRVPAPGVLANDQGTLVTTEILVPQGHFVSVTGAPEADGSLEKPWKLQDVLRNPPPQILPGETVWVREGVYAGQLTSNLSGTVDHPIIVRPYPGERVRIDTYDPTLATQPSAPNFLINGANVEFRNLEVYSSNPGPREISQSGSFQTEVARGGVSVRGDNIKIINFVVHDLNAGIGHWGSGGAVYGNIVFNNGWIAPDRNHGHGIYVQNTGGEKLVADNIVFNQLGVGIHAYGERGLLSDLDFSGNIIFNSGAAGGASYRAERDFLLGGGTPVGNSRVRNNIVYQAKPGGAFDIGYTFGVENEQIQITNNYIATHFRVLQGFDQIEFQNNTIATPQNSIFFDPPADNDTSRYVWDHNQYYTGAHSLFNVRGENYLFDQWRAVTRFDANSQQIDSTPPNQTFVRPNQYDLKQASVAIFNWTKQSAVPVDVSSFLQIGDRYRVQSVMDLTGDSILEGVYDGQPIEVPMQARSAPPLIGSSSRSPVGTDDTFGAFVLHRETSGPVNHLAVITATTTSQLGASITFSSSGSFVYTPNPTFPSAALSQGEVVTDTFSYSGSDGVNQGTASVSVEIIGVNDRPTATAGEYAIDVGGAALQGQVLLDDVDNDDDASSLSIRWINVPSRGDFTDVGHGAFRFDPGQSYAHLSFGQRVTETAQYEVTDRHGATVTGSVSIVVTQTQVPRIFVGEGNYVLVRDPNLDRWVLQRNGQELGRNVITGGDGITIIGKANSSDSLTIDYSQGNPIPTGGLFFDGLNGSGADRIDVQAGSWLSSQLDFATGRLTAIAQGNLTTSLQIAGIELLTVATSSQMSQVILGAGNDSVSLQSFGTNESRLEGATIPKTTFRNPSLSLSIDGGGGADAITVIGSSYPTLGADVTLRAETLDVKSAVQTSGGDFASVGETLVVSSLGSIRTSGGSISLDHSNSVTLDGSLLSSGGEINSRGAGSFLVRSYFATLSSQGTTTPGNIQLQHGGTVTVYGVTTGGGVITLQSGANIWLRGRIDTRGTAPGGIVTRGPNLRLESAAAIFTSGGSIVLDHSGSMLLNAAVQTGGGPMLVRGGGTFQTSSLASISTNGGDLEFDGVGDVTIGAGVKTSGGDVRSIAGRGKFFVGHYLTEIQTSGGDVLLNQQLGIDVHNVITVGGNVDLFSATNIRLLGRVDTRGGSGGLIRTRGVDLTSDINFGKLYSGGKNIEFVQRGKISLGNLVETSGGAISMVLNLANGLVGSLFQAVTPIVFYPGSRIVLDAGNTPLVASLGSSLRRNGLVQASRIDIPTPLNVQLVNLALGDENFVAQLTRSNLNRLDLVVTRNT
jgi:VCBS repeat-containing protein